MATLDIGYEPASDYGLRIERESGTTWALRAWQRLPLPRSELFPFFADAGNLARITPPGMRFDILTPRPIAMGVGTVIDYRIRTLGVPMRWRTLISGWNPPLEFTDTQVRGPYAEWVHRHRFIDLSPAETLMEDHVRFRLPLGRLGAGGGPLVRHQLRRIFAFRRVAIARLVGAGD
jgi:ligand-binding SRPBCC domain-containing protein